jgi:hypothetical protein
MGEGEGGSWIFEAGLVRDPIAFHTEGCRRTVSMKKGVRICSNPKRSFPRVTNLID